MGVGLGGRGRRVSRVSDPIITTDMVRRKSSMSIDDPTPRRHSNASNYDPTFDPLDPLCGDDVPLP